MEADGVANFSGYFDKSLTINHEYENSSLDYSKPMFSANFQAAHDQIYRPLIAPSIDNDRQSYKFEIGGQDDPYYSNLQSLRCHGTFKVLKADGTKLAAGANVSVVNLVPESIFEHINVSVNNQMISDHGRASHLKSYISKKYSYSKEVKEHNLTSNYFYDDIMTTGSPSIEVQATDKDDSKGFKTRMDIIKESQDVTFCFSPSIDLMSSEIFFPAGHTLSLEFERAHPEFSILAPKTDTEKYRIQLTDIYLEVRRIIPSKTGVQKLGSPTSERWLSFRRTTVRKRQVHAGISDVILSRLLDSTASLPYSIMILVLDNDQLISSSKNPYMFTPHGIKSYNLLFNGSSKPLQPLQIASGSSISKSLRAYDHFLNNLSILNANRSIGIDYKSWLSRDFALFFDMTGDFCQG